MRLSQYARENSITYRTAWEHFRQGLLPNARRLASGTIILDEAGSSEPAEDYTVTYARVSSSENKDNLLSQSKRIQDFCAAKGWIVSESVEEYGSGLNDDRKKLNKILTNPKVTRIVVEHKDRLTRFGFNYIKSLWDGEIIVINLAETSEKDLMQDFVSLVTSFTARLYGRRRSKRMTEKLIESAKQDV